MKNSIHFTIILSLFGFLMLGTLFAQDKEKTKEKGICFQPEDKVHKECVNFKASWYYAVPQSSGWVINVRAVNSKSLAHIWGDGQFFITKDEWKKLEGSLAAAGLANVCPPPEYRLKEDQLKPREEICKK